MADYLGLIIALAIGIPLLVVAVLFDARRRRRLEGDGESPPQRGAVEVDAHLPRYVTESDIERLPLPGAGGKAAREHPGTAFGFGHALPDFATAGEQAELLDVRILMVDGEVTSIRELLALLATATADAPLVIVASGFHEDVLGTLRANRRAAATQVVAATASEKDLHELAAVVGGEVLTVPDLKAGYTPEAALGRADAWTSDLGRTWVEPSKA
ncbi:hypothetical protein FOJ82_03800 [Tessaracoccus rhinocerotis]|uniref:Uncharacterized protein n=1 Tax=Tessaracoccus rhinocerotis TaxID=1689449 RepID=A0A553K5M3_9ACTN|nr:hypothetical protein [Tessaracoccus rhinocerotis]TRY20006.1 hypothetical protein FOJ82_03800 [Tessaracoccus rhinocerotis]